MNALVEDWTKNAPAGSDAAVLAMKQAIASATKVYETSQKSVTHAINIAQTNLNSTAETALKSVSAFDKSTKKK